MSAGLEAELLDVVRELRTLETRQLVLRNRDSENSRKVQAEVSERIAETEKRLATLKATIRNQRNGVG